MSNNLTVPAYGSQPLITILPGAINTTYSIKLVGRGAPGYGQAFAENAVRHLANFAHTVAPTGTPLTGQLWYDTGLKALRVYNNGAWNTIYGQGSTALVPPSAGGTGLAPTSADAYKFIQVNSTGTGFEFTTPSAALDGLYLRANSNTAPTVTNQFNLGNASAKWSGVYATEFFGVASSARFADLAERYEASEPLEAGDVVEIGGEKEVQKTQGPKSSDVFGVISTAPGFKMNSEAGDDATHPYVALVGRVPVKVKGLVKKGARLCSSDVPGVAMMITDLYSTEQVIGRALANKTSEGIELLEVTLGAK